MGEKIQLERVKLLVCDVDGVLTDSSIIYCGGSKELKLFNVKDGLGIKLAGWCGLPIVWLTGRTSEAVAHRADELGVHIYQNARDKDAGLRLVASEHNVPLCDIAYLGDDLNDLPALRLAGLPLAVADAVPEVIAAAHFVTSVPGGRGAVREVIEFILRGQGRWEAAVETYLEHLRRVVTPVQ